MRNAHDHHCNVLDSETYMNYYKVDISINIFQGEILICGSTIYSYFCMRAIIYMYSLWHVYLAAAMERCV